MAQARAKAKAKAKAKVTIDHDQIRRWAEARGGKPTAVKGTSRGKSDPGMLRIDFPGYSGEGKLQPISWDDWFDKFEESNLAMIFQDKTARGQKSNFNKLVSRDTIEGDGSAKGSRRKTPARRTSTRTTRSSERPAKRSSAQRTSARKNRAQRSTKGRKSSTGRK